MYLLRNTIVVKALGKLFVFRFLFIDNFITYFIITRLVIEILTHLMYDSKNSAKTRTSANPRVPSLESMRETTLINNRSNLARNQTCILYCIIWWETAHILSGCQFCLFLFDCYIEFGHLMTVNIRIDCTVHWQIFISTWFFF